MFTESDEQGAVTAAMRWTCPLCDADSERLFAVRGYWVRTCTACGHRFAELAAASDHVAQTYGDEYFIGGGAGYADYVSEGRLLRDHSRRYARRLARYCEPGRLLDVGAAAGFLMEGFLERGWQATGIEPNARMAGLARRRLGVEVHVGTLEDFRSGALFDLVTMIQVLPHFVEPRRALAAAAAVTRPRGWWLIEAWDRTDWIARLLGRHWHEYSPPSVLHWFSRAGLRRLLQPLGFAEIAHGHPFKRIDARHAKSLLQHALAGSAAGGWAARAARVVPDNWAVPYPSTDLFWVLYRRSD